MSEESMQSMETISHSIKEKKTILKVPSTHSLVEK